jgi:medium-chain acyl-[acyl-carrier-protein] hydrolase
VCPRPNPQAIFRLFCFSHAGGSALAYRAWAEKFPPSIEVISIQLPGREDRIHEPLFTQMEPLVRAVAQELLPSLTKPFACFGHSMGAVIAFELARYLRRIGEPAPTLLFVSGHPAPQIPNTQSITYNIPEPEFLEELKRLNGTPKEAFDYPELIQLMIPLLRADFEICQTYAYTEEAPLDCPISAFGGYEDQYVSRESLEAWKTQTTSSFIARMLPGDHFFLHTSKIYLLQKIAHDIHRLIGLGV